MFFGLLSIGFSFSTHVKKYKKPQIPQIATDLAQMQSVIHIAL